MKLYIYHGLDAEGVSKDVTHVIVDSSVTVIKNGAFFKCKHLVSVIMGDNVKRIEKQAFSCCHALRFIRLSKTLEYIGQKAFSYCESLEVLFIPWSVNFQDWDVLYMLRYHMREWPFHSVCYDTSVTTKQISEYLDENGNDAALAIDSIRSMTPLHMLSRNPHAPVDAILTLLKANTNVANVEDNRGKTPLFYALHNNPCAFVRMYSYLRKHNIDIGFDIQSWGVHPDGSSAVDNVNNPGCTPLNVLVKNPFVPANVIATFFLQLKMEDAFCLDNEGLSPLDHARECNVEGLVSMVTVLCNHRNSMASI